MRFELQRGDERHVVELTDLGGGTWRVKLSRRLEEDHPDAPDGRSSAALEGQELQLHVEETGEGSYSVLHGHDVHDVGVDVEGTTRTVSMPSGVVTLEHVDRFRAAGVSRAGPASGPQSVLSPMPGRVLEVSVVAGDVVAEGQALVVIEAMKMANELRSPIAGRVRSVDVEPGGAVEAGRAVVVVEPE